MLLAVALVLLLDLLHLRRVPLQRLHRVDLPHRQRDEQHPHDDRERDDRPRPRQADRAAQWPSHSRTCRSASSSGVSGSTRGPRSAHGPTDAAPNSLWSSRVVDPAGLHGLQRSSRQPASDRARARARTCAARRARTASSDGWYLQRPGGKSSAERVAVGVARGRCRAYLTPPPSRAPRRRAPQPVEAARLGGLRQARRARRARSRGRAGTSLEQRAPGLAELPLDPVADDRAADRLRHGDPEPRARSPSSSRANQ